MGPARVCLLVALVVAACGSDSDGSDSGAEPATAASPFTFDRAAVPDGYTLAVAGRGNQLQEWGSDSGGTDEPFTVLAPPDEDATGDRAVVVSVTGFEGYEGGLTQAARSRPGRPPEALVRSGDDLAVRVASSGASRDELMAIARRVRPSSDHRDAPAVDAPDGLEVVGSVDGDAVVALDSGFAPYTDDVPGPEGSYSAGWVPRGLGSLVVQTLRGDAADLAALGGLETFADDRTFSLRSADVDGAPAAVVEHRSTGSDPAFTQRAVVLDAPEGELVVVAAAGATLPGEDELLALAATVRPTDPGTWDRFVTEAAGGPGLRPDRGATEIARGTEGGVGWLLQSWPDEESAPPRLGEYLQQGEPGPVVDTCLKLSTGERTCTSGGGSQQGFAYGYARAEPERGVDFPLFSLVQVESPATDVRITTTTGTVTADVHEIDSGRRVALAFVDLAAYSGCAGLPRVEVLGADGGVISCPGG